MLAQSLLLLTVNPPRIPMNDPLPPKRKIGEENYTTENSNYQGKSLIPSKPTPFPGLRHNPGHGRLHRSNLQGTGLRYIAEPCIPIG
jgi:hypothetical protein